MKKTLILILTVLTFISCKKEHISVEGYLVDERNGSHFNPYNDAKVRLVVDQGYGYTDELGSCQVDQNGYYKIAIKHKKTGFYARLQLSVGDDWHLNQDRNMTVSNNGYYDFIIKCPVTLHRVITNQTSTNFDSIAIKITNSKGTTYYRQRLWNNTTLNISNLKGDEKNYLESNIYASGLFDTRYDTIYAGCRATVNDSINY
jgi:hypothetical protein